MVRNRARPRSYEDSGWRKTLRLPRPEGVTVHGTRAPTCSTATFEDRGSRGGVGPRSTRTGAGFDELGVVRATESNVP